MKTSTQQTKTKTEPAPAGYTPTPWQVVTANDYKSIAIAGPGKPMDAQIIAEIDMEDQECFHCDLNDEAKANGKLICIAVNSHESLLSERDRLREALENCIAELKMYRETFGKGGFPGTATRMRYESSGETLQQVESALAEGRW